MHILVLSKIFISFHFQMFYLLFHKTLEQNYWIKRYMYIKLWKMLPNFSKVVHHFHSFKQWIRVHILTSTQHSPSFLILITYCGFYFSSDEFNVLSHIYYIWTYFSVTFPFRVFLPSHFLLVCLSLPLGALCVFYIFQISVYCWIFVLGGFWFCFVCLFCLGCVGWVLVVTGRLFIAACGLPFSLACELQSAWAQ